MTDILDIRELSVELDNKPVLKRVSLSLSEGEIVGLVGQSGAGKSMIAKILLGTAPSNAQITGGSIMIDSVDILADPDAHRNLFSRSVALIPQDPQSSLNPGFTIGRQFTALLRIRGGLDRRSALTRAADLLGSVHLPSPETILERYPFELSGGMRQRVLIAMAFAFEPKLIVADEPTTALDVTVQKQILRLLRTFEQNLGTAILFITHDLAVVAKLCHRAAVIRSGEVVETAPVDQLFQDPSHAYSKELLAR